MSTRACERRCVGRGRKPPGSVARPIRPKGMLRDQRNAVGKVPRKARQEVHAALRDMFPGQDLRQRTGWRACPAAGRALDGSLARPLPGSSGLDGVNHRSAVAGVLSPRQASQAHAYYQRPGAQSSGNPSAQPGGAHFPQPGQLPAALKRPGHGAIRGLAHRSSLPGNAPAGRGTTNDGRHACVRTDRSCGLK